MGDKVYSMRLPEVTAAAFELYKLEHGLSTQVVLTYALQYFLISKPTIAISEEKCVMCNHPVKHLDYMVFKDDTPLDTIGCLRAYLRDHLYTALVQALGLGDLNVRPNFELKWADILDINRYEDLGRQHYVLDRQKNIYQVTTRKFGLRGAPPACAICTKPFVKLDYPKDIGMFAKRGRHYSHLDCLLPHTGHEGNLRLAVARAVKLFRDNVTQAHPDLDVPLLTFDYTSIRLDDMLPVDTLV